VTTAVIWLQQITAGVRQGKRYGGDDDDDLASAPNGGYNGKRTTVRRRYDGKNGQRQGVNSCKATRTTTKDIVFVLEFAGWGDQGDHDGWMGANQVQTR